MSEATARCFARCAVRVLRHEGVHPQSVDEGDTFACCRRGHSQHRPGLSGIKSVLCGFSWGNRDARGARNGIHEAHGGAGALHRDLIQSGALSAHLGRDYDFLLDLRETADYGGVAEASLPSATKAIEKPRTILAALQPLLPDGAV